METWNKCWVSRCQCIIQYCYLQELEGRSVRVNFANERPAGDRGGGGFGGGGGYAGGNQSYGSGGGQF